MRLCFAIVIAMVLRAQTAAPPQAPQPPFPPNVPAAAVRPPLPPDTVVAEVEGKKVTAAEMDKLLSGFPPQVQMAVRADAVRNLPQLLVFKRLEELAEQEGLDKKPPYKESLEYQRMVLLSQAEMNVARYRANVGQEEAEKVYKEHPERFRQAKVKAIYVAFNPLAAKGTGDRKLPAEEEAKAKIDDLRKQILAGADFGKVARENSDDKVAAAKDGDFGVIQKNSPYPDALKNAVFALKEGEVSEPLRQATGFYLFRVDEFKTQPLLEVAPGIMEEIRQAAFDAWMKSLKDGFTVKIENPAYFTPAPQGLPQPPR